MSTLVEQSVFLNQKKERLLAFLNSFEFVVEGEEIKEQFDYSADSLVQFSEDVTFMCGLMAVLAERAQTFPEVEDMNVHIPEGLHFEEDQKEPINSHTILLHKMISNSSALLRSNGGNAVSIQLEDKEEPVFASLRIMSGKEIAEARDSLQRKTFGKKGVRRLRKGR